MFLPSREDVQARVPALPTVPTLNVVLKVATDAVVPLKTVKPGAVKYEELILREPVPLLYTA
jgi:hypothetical protein